MPPDGGRTPSSTLIAAKFALAMQAGESLFAIHWLHSSTFDVVITAIEHLPRVRQIFQISNHRVLNKFVRRASGLRSKFLQAGLGFRFKTDFHERSLYQRDILTRKTCGRRRAELRRHVNNAQELLRFGRDDSKIAHEWVDDRALHT
jgi:hypothetical protein